MELINVEAVLRGEMGDWKTRAMIKRMPQVGLDKLELTLRCENVALLNFVEENGRDPTDKERLKVCRKVALEINGVSREQIKALAMAPVEAIKSLLKRNPQHGDTHQEQDNKNGVPK